MDAIFNRVSIRAYEDKPVESEKIEKILRAAMSAPSAVNQQPWEFYIVKDKSTLEKLSKVHQYAGMVAKAPVAIVVCYRKEKNVVLPEYLQIDCALATENILLEITAQGLGGLMLGIAPDEGRMKLAGDAINIPDELKVFTIIPFGYPLKNHAQQDRFDPSRIHTIE